MLEGLEITEVNLPHLYNSAETFRLDPEFYGKAFLSDEDHVRNHPDCFTTFDSLGLTVDGSAFYPAIEAYYGKGKGSFPFLRVADVDTMIDYNQCISIPRELCNRFDTLKSVTRGDIVLTKGGSVARIGLITDDAAACRDLIFLNSSLLSVEDRTYLYLYLLTGFCNRLLIRSSSQTAQPHLTITLVRHLPIFQASSRLKQECLISINSAFAASDKAVYLYKEAESILLTELGLQDWQPPEPLSYERKVGEVFAAGRMDAEHFQPRYDYLMDLLSKRGDLRLGNYLRTPIKRGVSPSYVEEGGDTLVINSQHVGKTHVKLDDNRCTSYSLLKHNERCGIVNIEDVLLNSTGYITIGRCQCLLEEVQAVVDNHVAIIRPTEQFDPVYLATFLNALPGQLQTERGWTGSSGQIELRTEVISDYRIWDAPPEMQKQIRSLVIKSHYYRQSSAALLERAKRAVEIAIEQSEDAALAYLEDIGEFASLSSH